jgi:hypothetical protein
VTDGASEVLTVTLSPVSSTGRLQVQWLPTRFEVLSDWPPNSQVMEHGLLIEGIAWRLDLGPDPWNGFPTCSRSTPSPGQGTRRWT